MSKMNQYADDMINNGWELTQKELPEPGFLPPVSQTRADLNPHTTLLLLIFEKLDELVNEIRSLK